jgi:nucleoside-diphosphate-sugar epimerase
MGINILVTGGAGYIGSILCRQLVRNPDYKVVVFDNFMYGVESILPLLSESNFDLIEGDIRDGNLERAVQKADVVIHLAAIVGYPACNANRTHAISVNVDGTKNILGYLAPSQRFLYASTGSVYGKVEGLCSEDTEINPLTLYAVTKYEGEQIAMERENSIALRFSTVFGVSPRLRMDLLVNDLVFQALRNKAVAIYEMGAKRTFLHCADAAKSYLLVLDSFEQMKGEVFNVGSPTLNLTKHDVVMTIKKYIDFYLLEDNSRKDVDQRDYAVDFSKIMHHGYQPCLNLDDGVKELLKLYSISVFNRHFRNA